MGLQEKLNSYCIKTDSGLMVVDESRNWPVCGGNKIRKLSNILLHKKVEGLLTFGSKYSSHCLATAYWGATNNCPVRLLIIDDEEPDVSWFPHLNLSARMGAEVIFVPNDEASERIDHERAQFSEYCWIPGGGHCLAGFIAYRDWFSEFLAQATEARQRDAVILPYGTGTTALGILAAIRDQELPMRVIGVSVARERQRCLLAAREILDENALTFLDIDDRFAGQYGERKPHHDRLRLDFLMRSGIFPDPIYNIRVVEYLQAERIDNVIMIHTGGQLNNLLP